MTALKWALSVYAAQASRLKEKFCATATRSDVAAEKTDAVTKLKQILQRHDEKKLAEIHNQPVGDNAPFTMFHGTPVAHAILNRMLTRYFQGEARARQDSPFAVHPNQRGLIDMLGMEQPLVDAPSKPHGFHKNLECAHLHMLSQWLEAGVYGLISCKEAKLPHLPTPASIQNPIIESRDVSRYPRSGLENSSFEDHPVYLLHDVASQVGPHELVEKLVAQNPNAHLFVTGVTPHEVLDRAQTFYPNSHTIEYEGDEYFWLPYKSESEGYSQKTATTVSWLRSSSILASNGRTYQVVMLDYKMGHAIWHVFPGNCLEENTRIFPTGQYVRLPPALTGTFCEEWVHAPFLTSMLDFPSRTASHDERNLSAKATQLATGSNAFISARERRIGVHVASLVHPNRTWSHVVSSGVYRAACFLVGRWDVAFSTLPDPFHYLAEEKRTRIIHPTPGGGWSDFSPKKFAYPAIRNFPSALERMSAATALAFTFAIPKIAIGQMLSTFWFRTDFLSAIHNIIDWFGLSPSRVLMIGAVAVISAAIPSYVARVVSRLAGHYYRLIWVPTQIVYWFQRFVQEVVGAPGYAFLPGSPGRGWLWQFGLWALILHEVLPGVFSNLFVPFFFITTSTPIASAVAAAVACLWVIVGLSVLMDHFAHRHRALMTPCPAGESSSPLHWARVLLHTLITRYPIQAVEAPPGTLLAPLRPSEDLEQPPSSHVQMPIAYLAPSRPMLPPATPVGVLPTGYEFPVWLNLVTTAYRANPNEYPRLTPNMSCVYDCVASALGGTAHMWFSWYNSVFSIPPSTLQAPYGPVAVSEIARMLSTARVGYEITGNMLMSGSPDPGYPTVHMKMSSNSLGGMFHVEPSTPISRPLKISTLASALASVRATYIPWWQKINADAVAAYASNCVRPTSFLYGIMGIDDELTVDDVRVALAASLSAQPIAVGSTDPTWDFTRFPVRSILAGTAETWPRLFDYVPRGTEVKVGYKASRILGPNGSLRAQLPKRVVDPSGFHPTSRGKTIPDKAVGASAPRVPIVPNWVRLREELRLSVSKFWAFTLPPTALEAEATTYQLNLSLAKLFSSDLKANPNVCVGANVYQSLQMNDAILDSLSQARTVKMILYLGTMGCGKTTAIMDYVRQLSPAERYETRIVSHQESLRGDLRERFEVFRPDMTGRNFPTIKHLLVEQFGGTLIVDDAGKFWPGALDYLLAVNPLIHTLVINGDPCQGKEVFPIPGVQTEHSPHMIDVVAKSATKYATTSHRMFGLLAHSLGMHTTNPEYGFIKHCTGPQTELPVLTASPRYVQVLSGGGRQAYTYGAVQGHDFASAVEIDMTGLEGAITDPAGTVAISRSKTGNWLHGNALDPMSKALTEPTGSAIINALLYDIKLGGTSELTQPSDLMRMCYAQHLHRCMPSLKWFAQVGYDSDYSEFSLHSAACKVEPILETNVDELQPFDTIPVETMVEEIFDREVNMRAKEDREVAARGIVTNQFTDNGPGINAHRHRRDDDATYFMSVEKRLTPAAPDDNKRRMLSQPRQDMIDEYDRLMPNPPQLTAEKLAYYTDKAIDEYTGKRDRPTVEKKLAAHDPDRTGSDIRISLKGQVIKKIEKSGTDAVAGQLIHEFDINQTIGDAAYFAFLADEVIPKFPSQVQFFSRESMASFIKRTPGIIHKGRGTYSSDVTRWDVGCDAAVLNFDRHIFERSGYPRQWVDSYVKRRLNSRSQHGPMATMQNSGDRGTWVMNTIRRAVVSSLVLHVGPGDTLIVNGDDAWLDRACTADEFPDSPWVFKDHVGAETDFSGFTISERGTVTYSPTGLLHRCWILEEHNVTDPNRWLGYVDLAALLTEPSAETLEVFRILSAHVPSGYLINRTPPQFLDQVRQMTSARP